MKERNLEQKKTPMRIDLIRHGMTRGNEERRYIGITDEPLSERGRKLAEQCMYEMPEIVFSSPLKRCVETAEILYPDQDIYIIEELRECDFGIFEGKNAEELSKTEAYQRWIDSNATIPFPRWRKQGGGSQSVSFGLEESDFCLPRAAKKVCRCRDTRWCDYEFDGDRHSV